MNLRTRITIPVLALIITVAVAVTISNLTLMGRSVENEFEKRGISIATSLAIQGRIGILLQDSTQLANLLTAQMTVEEIGSIAFYGHDGAKIAGRGEEASAFPTTEDWSSGVICKTVTGSNRQEMSQFCAPVFSHGAQNLPSIGGAESTPIGFVKVEISKSGVMRDKRNSFLLSLGICLIASLVGFVIVYAIVRTLAPLQVLARQARMIAAGDLTVEVVHESLDEVGQLSSSFKVMVENLRKTIGKAMEASDAVAGASSEISSSTEEMAAGTQEQSNQSGEVSSAVEEMTRTIVENSKNAVQAAETAKLAKAAAEQGGKVVAETVTGMNRIALVVNHSADTVRALGKSSDQIGEIIVVINDIADQTNLLALNAAIEAARAGEQGRGFAVVADEVRKLAERTTEATKEIASMIKTIQNDTMGAVESMSEGTKQVDEGIKLAERAGVSLKEIVYVSQTLTDMIAQIASASEQQANKSETIEGNFKMIAKCAQETADSIARIARTAANLNGLSEQLQAVTQIFKTSSGASEARAVKNNAGRSGGYNIPQSLRASRSRILTESIIEPNAL